MSQIYAIWPLGRSATSLWMSPASLFQSTVAPFNRLLLSQLLLCPDPPCLGAKPVVCFGCHGHLSHACSLLPPARQPLDAGALRTRPKSMPTFTTNSQILHQRQTDSMTLPEEHSLMLPGSKTCITLVLVCHLFQIFLRDRIHPDWNLSSPKCNISRPLSYHSPLSRTESQGSCPRR